MEHIHWKKLTNTPYLGEWDLPEGQDIIVTIKDIKIENVKNNKGEEEELPVLYFVEQLKPMILNKTNMANIARACRSDYIDSWQGMKIQLYRELVFAFGEKKFAVRVRDFKPEG